VEHDHPRVEIGQDRDPAEHRLGGHPEKQHQRQPPDVAARRACPVGDDQRRQRDAADQVGDHPIGELDL